MRTVATYVLRQDHGRNVVNSKMIKNFINPDNIIRMVDPIEYAICSSNIHLRQNKTKCLQIKYSY